MMAGKRSATSELNHDNWDQDEEAEEAGTFQIASQDILQKRVIKTAKRRAAGQSSEDRGPNVFSSFTGFAKAPSFGNTSNSSNNKSSPFSFLTQTKSDLQKDNKNGIPSSTQSSTNDVNKNSTENAKSSEYYSKLKGLNESVSQWIKTHVDSNPICILTPIFKDYEKYLKEIEELNPNIKKSAEDKMPKIENSTNQNASEIKNSTVSSTSSSTQPTFSFGIQKQSTAESKSVPETKPSAPSFSFGVQKEDEKKPMSSPLFSFQPATKSTLENDKEKHNSDSNNKTPFVTPFGNTAAFSFGSNSTQNSTGFSFGSGKPFTFSNVSAPPPSENKEQDEEDEPPKVEFTPVVEEGSIYNTKCKLFVKKENEFVERGVGQLYLKQIEGSEKTQLIVRADTNLGNLLMNIVLTKTIPTSRKGKNHVMIICVPTPEEAAKCKADQNPLQTMLIKVKNSEEADKLLEMIEKHKN